MNRLALAVLLALAFVAPYATGQTPTCTVSDNSSTIRTDVDTLDNAHVVFSFSAASFDGGVLYYQCGATR